MKSNDESKTVHFSFRLNENDDESKKIQNFKELGFESQSELIRKAVNYFFENSGQRNNIEEETKKLKLEKLKKENIQLYIKNRIALIESLKYSPDDALSIANGNKTFDENAMHCPECSFDTNSAESIDRQISQITSHIKAVHKRDLTESEINEILEIGK